MFSFFKRSKKQVKVDLSPLKADMHSHLLPGIDDGAKTLEDSLILVRGLAELGYTKLVTSPHIMVDLYPNTKETISSGLKKLKNEVRQQKLKIEMNAAAEYYLDDYFDSLLTDGIPLLTITNNLVLVEFSFVSTPINFKDKLFQMQIKGYQPVIAHPERYLYFAKFRGQYDELKSMGCLFQVNLLSFAGYYGKASLELANYLADKQYIDLLGTDMHHERHLEVLNSSAVIMDVMNKLMDTGKILNPTL
jgi:tyrosine-protein phosphatase YwqE